MHAFVMNELLAQERLAAASALQPHRDEALALLRSERRAGVRGALAAALVWLALRIDGAAGRRLAAPPQGA
jgi:hypothetical protein